MLELQNCLKIYKDLKRLVSELLFCKTDSQFKTYSIFADCHENSFASINDNLKTKTYC